MAYKEVRRAYRAWKSVSGVACEVIRVHGNDPVIWDAQPLDGVIKREYIRSMSIVEPVPANV